jgi:hypothetical protein
MYYLKKILKNPAASCEEKVKDIMICAKRYYHTFKNEMTIFHPYGKKTYS